MKIQAGFFLLLFLGNNFFCFGQELPKVIPPSPTAMSIQKYGDYPVGHYTGVPEISIPLFTIQQGDITVPISLSYHASGIKLTDQNGFIGLGWILNAGGRISRTIIGPADEVIEMPAYIKTAQEISSSLTYPSSDYAFLRDLTLGHANSEFDIFSYGFGSHSGKFVLKNDEAKTPVLFPYEPLKITKQLSSSSIDFFEIMDEEGIKYRFGESITGSRAYEDAEGGRTGWMVTDIISASDPSNDVNFTYASRAENRMERNDQFILDDNTYEQTNNGMDDWWCLNTYGTDNYSFGYNGYQYSTWMPSEISFKNGKVKFILNADKMVDKMEIWDANNNLIRYVKFIIVNSTGSSQRKLLSSVEFYDNNNLFIDQYSFQYYGDNLPLEDGPGGNGRDFWGYYNGADNVSLVPKWTNIQTTNLVQSSLVEVGNADRNTNENAMKQLSLERITYPTGGSTFFDLEANRYSSTKLAGGLRIKKIISYDENGIQKEVKTYKYGVNERGYGQMDIEPSIEAYYYVLFGVGVDQTNGSIQGTFRKRIFPSEPVIDINPNGSPVVYTDVTEYFGDENNNTGKIIYSYDFVHKYWLYDPKYEKLHFSFLKDWNSGQLKSKSVYKNTGTPSVPAYEMVHSTYNEYEENIRESVRGLLCYRYRVYQCAAYPDDEYEDANYNGDVFMYADFNIVTGEKRLKSITETDYTSGGQLSTRTEYVYSNNIHIQPTQKITTNSKGETISIEYKYPHDFIAQQPYTDMVNVKHIWSPVIEKSIYKNTTQFLQSTKTNYNFWNGSDWGSTGTSIIVPQTIEAKTLGNPSEIKMHFNAYSTNGNITSVSRENDVYNSYLWGYKSTYPIAQAINAKSNEIFFESFEDPDTWNNLTALDNTKPRTGKYSARIDNPGPGEYFCHSTKWLTISLSTPTKYKYSGWVYSNGPSAEIFLFMKRAGEAGYFSYVDAVSTNVTGKWVYLEKEFMVPADVTQLNIRIDNNNPGTVWFDDIRLHPSPAQMTTYTYEPLVGMTSQTDANNRTTYYEYDALGRLSLVRDQDRNILKKICYNYAGQPEACGMDMTPLWQSTGLTQCKPCPSNNSYTSNIQQRQEKDNNPNSTTYNSLRWVDDGVSSNCTIVADWQQINLYCEQNGSGQYTGNQIKVEQDKNPCSSTYNQTRNIVILNCSTCPKPANWQSTGNYSCVKDGGNNNTGAQEREEKDMESCSSTYNQLRWVSNGTNCATCPKPSSWQSTGNYRCVKDGSNNNTGYQEREEKDMESCSSSYNTLRWVSNGYNTTACPLPYVCSTSNCSGANKKCINNNCETGIKVYTASTWDASLGKWVCTYHYEWSDDSWSQNYSETSRFACPI